MIRITKILKKISQGNKNEKIQYGICDYDKAFDLSKINLNKGQLMQGYWQTDSLIKEIRNYEEHWRKSGMRRFLEKELNRKIIDPLNETEITRNLIILPEILLLMIYHIIEVLQTWIDTFKLVKL